MNQWRQMRGCLLRLFVCLPVLSAACLAAEPAVSGESRASLPSWGPEDDWPQLQHDAQHTGYAPAGPAAPINKLRWRIDFGPESGITRSVQPIVYQGTVYIGTKNGIMRGIELASGKETWRQEMQEPIVAAAAAADGRVFFTTARGKVVACDAKTGAELWRESVVEEPWDAGISTAPVLADGKAFIAGRSGKVCAFSQDKGVEIWRTDTGGLILNTPAWNNGRLYFLNEDMAAHALDASSGKVLWRTQLTGKGMAWDHTVVWKGKVIVVYTAVVLRRKDHSTPSELAKEYDWLIELWQDGRIYESEEGQKTLQGWLAAHPENTAWAALDEETGAQPYYFALFQNNNHRTTMYPPTVGPAGLLYQTVGMFPLDFVNVGNMPARRVSFASISPDTGRVVKYKLEPPFECTGDEQTAFSAAGDVVFANHCHPGWGYKSYGSAAKIEGGTYFGPGRCPNVVRYRGDFANRMAPPAYSRGCAVLNAWDVLMCWGN